MDVRIVWPRTTKYVMEYLAGLVTGDGQVETKRITITDSEKEFLEKVAELISRHMGLKAILHKRSDFNAYYMRIYSKELASRIGKIINELKSRPTLNFIRGFFDAEGSVYKEGKYIVIEIKQHEGPLIANISICLLYTSPSPRDLSTSRMPSSA